MQSNIAKLAAALADDNDTRISCAEMSRRIFAAIERDEREASGADLIVQERMRQIEEEGYDASHDDMYEGDNSLILAAIAYLFHTIGDRGLPWWPWPKEFFKPKNKQRDLVRAGALIAAEIDRTMREAQKAS